MSLFVSLTVLCILQSQSSPIKPTEVMFLASTRSVTGVNARLFDLETGLWRTLWTNNDIHWPNLEILLPGVTV